MEKDNKYTREGDKRFTLRIEKGLFEQLEASARACKRSIGRQIEYILDKVLNGSQPEKDLIQEIIQEAEKYRFVNNKKKTKKSNKKRA